MTDTATAGRVQASPPPHAVVLSQLQGRRISQVVYALTALGVPDALAGGPRRVPDLAEELDADADVLARLMRCASGAGMFAERVDGRFALSAASELLCSDVPGSLRDLVLYNGHDIVAEPLAHLLDTLRSGTPAFEALYGRTFFEHLATDPAAAEVFNRAMTRMTGLSAAALLDRLDLSGHRAVVDVGGGHGRFLIQLLRRDPHLRGTLVDLPSVCRGAAETLAEAPDVSDRARLHPGDFFSEVPSGADAYVIKAVLHDWDDEHATRILGSVRAAMAGRPDARLYLCEFVLSGPNTWDLGKSLDIDMMLRFGGRERSLPEWRHLLARAGFTLLTEPDEGAWSVLICCPDDSSPDDSSPDTDITDDGSHGVGRSR